MVRCWIHWSLPRWPTRTTLCEHDANEYVYAISYAYCNHDFKIIDIGSCGGDDIGKSRFALYHRDTHEHCNRNCYWHSNKHCIGGCVWVK
jgi:hypothetical protein